MSRKIFSNRDLDDILDDFLAEGKTEERPYAYMALPLAIVIYGMSEGDQELRDVLRAVRDVAVAIEDHIRGLDLHPGIGVSSNNVHIAGLDLDDLDRGDIEH